MLPKIIIVTGISGSGKTTVARHLLKRGEVAFDSKINAGLYQFVDSDGNATNNVYLQDEEWKKKYKWQLNEELLNRLLEENQTANRIFLCGRANLFQYWDKAVKVLLLKVDTQTLLNRLNDKSRDNLFAKDPGTQKRLLGELEITQDKITQKGAIMIDACVPVNEVVDQILFSI